VSQTAAALNHSAPALESARAEAQQTMAGGSKSFALAARLLGTRAASDGAVLYAWCRYVDDEIDCAPIAQAPKALASLQDQLKRIYERTNGGPALGNTQLEAFAELVSRRNIPQAYPQALLDGMKMDVLGHSYTQDNDLSLYCFRVAGVVGLMMSHVLGLKDDKALVRATHLGMAMQLTNICRDVLDDWRLGRVYIPQALIAAQLPATAPLPAFLPALQKIAQDEPPQELAAALSATLATLLVRADKLYNSGALGLRDLPFRAALAIRVARLVYRDIGRVVARRGHNILAGRAVVSGRRKAWLVLRALFEGFCEIPSRLRDSRPVKIPQTILSYPDDIPHP